MNQMYYIIRHGKAIPEGIEYGEKKLTATLLPEGIPAIRRLAEFVKTLPETTNFVSPVIRAKQTAEIITDISGRTFTEDSRLTEYYQESFLALCHRVNSFLTDRCLTSDGPFLICSHGTVISAIKHILLNETFKEKDALDYINTGEMLIIKPDKTYEIKDFNKPFYKTS